MNREKVWEDFTALPLEAQQQAADFIAFLRSRYRQFTPDQKANLTDLGNEAFIGMWRDRVDMEDSSQWVRDVRRREWK
jgi:hypothetical protein